MIIKSFTNVTKSVISWEVNLTACDNELSEWIHKFGNCKRYAKMLDTLEKRRNFKFSEPLLNNS